MMAKTTISQDRIAANVSENGIASTTNSSDVSSSSSHYDLPPLFADRSFLGMAITQFLGAFNDNLFKSLVLLLATPSAAAAVTTKDRQGEAQLIFAAAFLIFSGFAGYVSDRYSKRLVVVCCKVAEIGIMTLGLVCFVTLGREGLNALFVVLFLMGTHSAFFGPAKYGILPELIRPTDLPRGNGFFLMLTFLAIIFGTAVAGILLEKPTSPLWPGSLICIAIAVVGTITATLVRPLPPAQPNLKHTLATWGISKEIRALLRRDRELFWANVVTAIFYMVGGIVLQTVNALGKTQLGRDDRETGFLAASIGVGIAAGCILGGVLSRDRVRRSVVMGGAVGVVAALISLSLPGPNNGQLLGYYGSFPALILVGLFSGMFIVPVQVLLQSRPPKADKGRMIATMNQCSWVGIILGALLWEVCLKVLASTGWPRSTVFAVTALLMFPVALFYRPTNERLPDSQPA
jgi:acyl-[acyl-carrier-protein]-phospholipid O-acyltransferase/long-chain-fatty-acid--[acyl-carrier-protein] ligase